MEKFMKGSPLLIFSICFLHCVHHANSKEFTGLNLALGKPTWQFPPGIAPSNRAVDGNTNSLLAHGSCSHTADNQSKEPAYWSVDLLELFYITGIKVFNRKVHEGRLRRFRLYGYPGNVTLYDDATQSSPQYRNNVIYVPVSSDQRYGNFTVYLPNNGGEVTVLTLCEVQIFGGCRVPVLNNGFFTEENRQQLDITKMISSGTKIHANCSTGHSLSSEDTTLTCGYNYTWDNSGPRCTAIICTQLSLENGKYIYNQSYFDNPGTFGSVVTAECDKGFNLQGNGERRCQDNESWSGANPTCSIVMCKYPRGFDNGHYVKNNLKLHTEEYANYNTTIQAVCEKGYTLASVKIQRRCTEHGTWTGGTPRCNPYKYVFGGKDDKMQTGFVISISVNVVFFLIVLVLFGVIFVLKRRYNRMIQQSAVYMDLTARLGAVSQETVYSDISDNPREVKSKKSQKVYENTAVTGT